MHALKGRLPITVAAFLLATCGLGIASVYLPWASFDLFGKAISIPGSDGWVGRVTVTGFAVLATLCLAQILWPSLPRWVPLAVAIIVGLGVLGVALGPSLLYPHAELSVDDGGQTTKIPTAMGSGKYLAMAAGTLAAVVAGWQWFRDHKRNRGGDPST